MLLRVDAVFHMNKDFACCSAALGKSAQKTVASWQLYFQQPVLPASLAFIMLHFNAVLSPGCLMTAFLSSRGLSGTAAAVFR